LRISATKTAEDRDSADIVQKEYISVGSETEQNTRFQAATLRDHYRKKFGGDIKMTNNRSSRLLFKALKEQFSPGNGPKFESSLNSRRMNPFFSHC
jgi:hypothetical protein